MLKFISSNRILFLFLVIFTVSLIYSFSFQYQPTVDARAYDKIAWNLAQGFGYRESLEGLLINDHAIIRAGPGYEFFLAGIYKLFGHHYEAVWLIQAFLHALSAFLVFLISKSILKHEKAETIAFLGMIFYGFFPDLIIASSMLLTETLAIFLLLLSVYLFLRHFEMSTPFRKSDFREGSRTSYFLLGLVAAFMVLVRAQLGLFILPLLVFLILRKRWGQILLFFVLFVLVLTPWTLRNHQLFGKLIPTTVLFGNNLAMGNHPGATGEQLDTPYLPLEELFEQGYIKGDKLATKFALDFITDHPLEFAKITLYRTSIYFSFARPTGFWPNFSSLNKIITLVLSSLYSLLAFCLGIAGVLFALKNRNRGLFFKEKLLYILFIAVLMPLSVIFIVVETRYRYPIYPFLAVFSGLSFWWLWSKRKEILKPLLYSLLIIGTNTGFDVLRNFSRIIQRISNL